MADPKGAAEQPETQGNAGNGQHELSLEDRAILETLGIFARRDMVTDGKIDLWKVADEIEPTIVSAIVKAEKDRTRIGVTPTRVMEVHFDEVPKRSEVQSDDEEVLKLADLVYGYTKREVFRCLGIMPDAPIQSRLAANGSEEDPPLVLCRMKGTRGQEEVAYVTRNKQCINKDNNLPAYKAVQAAQRKAAALTGMSIERVQEHGKWFRNQFKSQMRLGLDAANETVQLALDVGNGSEGDGSEGNE